METKVCEACLIEKKVCDFYFRQGRGTYHNRCKRCCIEGKKVVRAAKTSKVCKHCGVDKPFSEYQKAGGGKWLQPYCKPCDTIRKIKYCEENREKVISAKSKYYIENRDSIIIKTKKRYADNPESTRQRAKEWRLRNLDKVKKKDKEYRVKNREYLIKKERDNYKKNINEFKAKAKIYRDNRTAEQIAEKKKYDRDYKKNNKQKLVLYREKNIDKIREGKRRQQAAKMATDINFRIIKNFRSRVRIALKGIVKSDTTANLLGCSADDFKAHIESQFKEGMSWDNYGRYGWHIDHKIPLSWFNLQSSNCQKLAFSFNNHQPLWWEENLSKNNKFHTPIHLI